MHDARLARPTSPALPTPRPAPVRPGGQPARPRGCPSQPWLGPAIGGPAGSVVAFAGAAPRSPRRGQSRALRRAIEASLRGSAADERALDGATATADAGDNVTAALR